MPRVPLVALALAAVVAMAPRAGAAMPRNSRQAAAGYWAGGMPEVHEIADLHAAGIRLIVSAVELSAEVVAECEALGVTQVSYRMGATFRRPRQLVAITDGFEPAQIYLHCDHGGDRAGAMLALLLVAREHWEPDHALLAVAYPETGNVNAIVNLIEGRGLRVTSDERARYAGIYSGSSNGGTGGLKAIGERYKNLVVTTLDAFEAVGASLEE